MEGRIKQFLEERKKTGLLRGLTEVELASGGRIFVSGRKYVNFSSNDYLGLSCHPDIIKSARETAVPVFGSSASRLMTGSTVLHHQLEKNIASLKNKPAALIFNSGYQANVGVISALCGKGDVVFSDRLNHASIVDGMKLSRARIFRFRHNDIEHLERMLAKERSKYSGALIITETVFSMDGDLAPIADIIRLKKKFNCMLLADEAHATGVFGKHGGGMLQDEDAAGDTDIVMGTFGKALGSFGAYVAVSTAIRDYLVNTCRSFIYSTALPTAVINANIAALNIIKGDPDMGKRLLANAEYFRKSLKDKGFKVGGQSQIVPVVIGGAEETVRLSAYLKDLGYWVTPVRPPTVPEGTARLRLSVTLDHDREILDKFVKDISRYVRV